MQTKKSPKADVKRNSSIYLAIGLLLMLIFTNMTINYKSYEKSEISLDSLNLDDDDDEEVIELQDLATPPPPPPPPPAPPEVIEVVEDDEEVEETIIESNEVEQDTEIAEVEDVEVDEVEEIEEVPFNVIENVPVFPGCEGKSGNAAKKKCMEEKVKKFVNRKFNTDLASDLGLEGRQRITVLFKIDKTGSISNVQARAPHPGLAKEAKKVVNALPKMKPGKQRGKAVTVSYALPIIFVVEN